MSYVYINEERAAALAIALRDVEIGAQTLSIEINTAITRADALGVPGLGDSYRPGGPVVPGGWLTGHLLAAVSSDPGSRVHQVAMFAPVAADEIDRRLAHLGAHEALTALGFPMSPDTRFDDADPPSEDDIAELANLLRSGHGAQMLAWTVTAHYSAAEVDAALASLTDGELEDFSLETVFLPNTDRQLVLNLLWGSVGRTQMERLNSVAERLEPQLKAEDRNWTQSTIDLDSPFMHHEANQRGLGNCWLMAGLGATAVNNEEFLRQNISENPNGSYTVTLYDNGRPVEITVSPFLPDPPYGGRYSAAYSHNWASVYEKAAAQYFGNGRYDGIEGSFGGRGLEIVTGQDSNLHIEAPGPWDFPSIDEIEERLAKGQPMVASTGSRGLPIFGSPHDDLIPMHVYVIVGVVERNGERVIHLRNPWGHSAGKTKDGKEKSNGAEDVYLTEAEFKHAFASANSASAP